MIRDLQYTRAILVLIFGFVLIGALYLFSDSEKSAIANSATEIIQFCSSEEYRPRCYDQKIPKLLNKFSLNKVFEVVRIVQSQDEEYGYCHVLGHELGGREVAKDPSKWMNIITKCPVDGICANGCLHGALIERFSSEEEWSLTDEQIEEAKPDLSIACDARNDWKPTPLDKAICYHGLGHLTVYITNADLPKALTICDDIAVKESGENYLSVCYEGVFMQLFQPLEPEDFALIGNIIVNKDNLELFCQSFETQEQNRACFIEGWPIFKEEVRTPEGLISFCSLPGDEETQKQCFRMLFYTIGQSANFDEARINEFCSAVPDKYQGNCFRDAALSMIQADPRFIEKSVNICNSIQDRTHQNTCYDGLVNYASYRFHQGSPEHETLCKLLPFQWETRCSMGEYTNTPTIINR